MIAGYWKLVPLKSKEAEVLSENQDILFLVLFLSLSEPNSLNFKTGEVTCLPSGREVQK